jgi:hypothetical protein
MPHPTRPQTKSLAQEQRRARLACELRANLRKRKAQARSRALDEAPDHPAKGRDRRPDEAEAQEAARSDKRGPTGEVA